MAFSFRSLELRQGEILALLLLVLLACTVVLTALTAMGIMIALLGLVWRQVGSIAGVLGILFEMLAGAYLPVTAFPKVLQTLAYLLPYTWGYDLIRYYSSGSRFQFVDSLSVFIGVRLWLHRIIWKNCESTHEEGHTNGNRNPNPRDLFSFRQG